jgi:hypothetical protein
MTKTSAVEILIAMLGALDAAETRKHQDVVRALALLDSKDIDISTSAAMWLQSHEGDEERRVALGFGGPPPAPAEIVRGLLWIMGVSGPTLITVDQIDSIVSEANALAAEPGAGARRATSILQTIAGGLMELHDLKRRAMTLISCLESTWPILREKTVASAADRFRELSALPPVVSIAIAERLITGRLSRAYAACGFTPPYATYPFTRAAVESAVGLRPRAILMRCQEFQETCLVEERVRECVTLALAPTKPMSAAQASAIEVAAFDEVFLAACAAAKAPDFDDETAVGAVLGEIAELYVRQLSLPDTIDGEATPDPNPRNPSLHGRIAFVFHEENHRQQRWSFRALAQESPVGFQSRLKAAITASGVDANMKWRRLVVLRRNPPPTGPKTEQLVKEFLEMGGRLVAPSAQDFAAFDALIRLSREAAPGFDTWLKLRRPLFGSELFREAGLAPPDCLPAERMGPPPVVADIPPRVTPVLISAPPVALSGAAPAAVFAPTPFADPAPSALASSVAAPPPFAAPPVSAPARVEASAPFAAGTPVAAPPRPLVAPAVSAPAPAYAPPPAAAQAPVASAVSEQPPPFYEQAVRVDLPPPAVAAAAFPPAQLFPAQVLTAQALTAQVLTAPVVTAPVVTAKAVAPAPVLAVQPLPEQVLSEQVLHEQVLSEQVLHEQVLHEQVLHEQVLHEQVSPVQVSPVPVAPAPAPQEAVAGARAVAAPAMAPVAEPPPPPVSLPPASPQPVAGSVQAAATLEPAPPPHFAEPPAPLVAGPARPLSAPSNIAALSALLTPAVRPPPPMPLRPPPRRPASDRDYIPIGRAFDRGAVLGPVTLLAELLPRHVATLAGPGAGKSVLVSRMVEEAALIGIPSLVLDFNNDLARLAQPWPSRPDEFTDDDARKARAYFEHVEVAVWTPRLGDGRPFSLSPLPNFAELGASPHPEEREAALDMARATLEPYLPSHGARAVKMRGVLSEVLRRFAVARGASLEELVQMLYDLPEEASHLPDSADLAREIADDLVAAMAVDTLLLDAGGPLDPTLLFESPTGKTRVSVLNLSGLQSDRAREAFVNQLHMALFTWIKQNPMPSGCLFVLDDAHLFAPAKAQPPCKRSAMALMAQGRRYGLGVILATPEPRALDAEIVAGCATQIFGRVGGPASIGAVREFMAAAGGGADDIAHLRSGEFYFVTDGFIRPVKIRAPLCLTRRSETPPPGEAIAEVTRARA